MKAISRMKGFRMLLPYARPYYGGIGLGVLYILLSDFFQVLSPWVLGRGIDALSAGVAFQTIALHALVIVGLALLAGAARFGMRYQLNGISRRIENDLRDDFFERLLALDAGFYGRMRTGDLMSRATNDVNAVRMAIGPGVMYLVNTVVLSVFTLFFMLRYDVRLTLIALVPLAFLGPVMLYFSKLLHRGYEKVQDQFGVIQTMVQENLSGVRIVRAYVQEQAQEAEFEALNAQYMEQNMAVARVAAVFQPLLTVLAAAGMLLVFWFGGLLVMSGGITSGEFVAFGVYLGMLIWPMMAIGWVTNLFQRGSAALARVRAVMTTTPAVRPPAEPVSLGTVRGAIEFRNVSFRYPGTERAVLRDVSFRIAAGETAALVGPTGAGKSTVIALLTRRYDPTAGEIRIDDVPLDRIPFADLRAAIGIVPQDAFVFSETVAENIAFGLDGTPAELQPRVERAAAIARLMETVEGFPRRFETRLGERGVNLSGGQRQRTTLARALAHDPRIILLDDALSAVDTHTETEILDALRTELRDRTAMVVSHRVSAVMHADRIFVIDDGRIVERGTHAELMQQAGLYASLLRRQLIEEDLEVAPLAGAAAYS